MNLGNAFRQLELSIKTSVYGVLKNLLLSHFFVVFFFFYFESVHCDLIQCFKSHPHTDS